MVPANLRMTRSHLVVLEFDSAENIPDKVTLEGVRLGKESMKQSMCLDLEEWMVRAYARCS